jgi:hypothetical protein
VLGAAEQVLAERLAVLEAVVGVEARDVRGAQAGLEADEQLAPDVIRRGAEQATAFEELDHARPRTKRDRTGGRDAWLTPG